MKHAASISAILLALVITLPQCTRANGPGGGHGGSAGHGGASHGGHGGRSFSGHSSTHSLSHSFAHIFGHRGKASPASPAMFPRKPTRFAFGQRTMFLPRRKQFGFSACTNNGLFPCSFRFGFDCLGDGLFFDPFFFGAFSMLGPMPGPGSAYAAGDSSVSDEVSDSGDTARLADVEKGQQPVTLLQLLDGSMYGLTSYQVIGHNLHYTTTYGGQNSVPLDRIDFTQTLELNAERHVPFVLEPKSTPH